MTPSHLLSLGVIISACFFLFARFRIRADTLQEQAPSTSLPRFYGWYAAVLAFVPIFLGVCIWVFASTTIVEILLVNRLDSLFASLPEGGRDRFLAEMYSFLDGQPLRTPSPDIAAAANMLIGLRTPVVTTIIALSTVGALSLGFLALRFIEPRFNAHAHIDRTVVFLLLLCSILAIIATLGIILSLLFETIRFFEFVSISQLFSTDWLPRAGNQTALDGDAGKYGVLALFSGTFLISFVAISIALPIGLLVAVYLSQYASHSTRRISKPMLELLAGIPTVVYGFFAIVLVGPFLQRIGGFLGLDVAPQSAIAAGAVMAIMIIPYVSSLCDDALSAVPSALRNGSLALGSTTAETVLNVLLPAALPGISSAVLLAVSRTIGETMIVLMAAGLAANLTLNPLASVTTVTVQIVQSVTGDVEFDSVKTLSAFMLGMLLFVTTLMMNVFAFSLRRRGITHGEV